VRARAAEKTRTARSPQGTTPANLIRVRADLRGVSLRGRVQDFRGTRRRRGGFFSKHSLYCTRDLRVICDGRRRGIGKKKYARIVPRAYHIVIVRAYLRRSGTKYTRLRGPRDNGTVCVCVCVYIYIYTHTHTHTRDVCIYIVIPCAVFCRRAV